MAAAGPMRAHRNPRARVTYVLGSSEHRWNNTDSAKPVVAATGDVASRWGICPVFETDYYKLLEVDPEADPDVIAAAYRVLTKRVRAKQDLEEADQIRLAELELAYVVLSNPAQRPRCRSRWPPRCWCFARVAPRSIR